MGPHGGEDDAKDWGAGEVHDWGVPPPGRDVPLSVPSGIASVSDASGGAFGISPLLFEPAKSTPLEEDEPEPSIPPVVLWAMEDRKHSSWRPGSEEEGEVRCRLGSGDRAVFVIDDGRDHCMIGRLVGEDSDACVYCLVGRIARDVFLELRDGVVPLEDSFADARDISLAAVFESDTASNVVLVQHYRQAQDVPVEYLPGGAFLEFTDEG